MADKCYTSLARAGGNFSRMWWCAGGTDLGRVLQRDLNVILEQELVADKPPLYEPVRFKSVPISEYLQDFIKENPRSHTRIRLNRLLLEAAYPKELASQIAKASSENVPAVVQKDQRVIEAYLGA